MKSHTTRLKKLVLNLNTRARIKFFTHGVKLPDAIKSSKPIVYFYTHGNSRRDDFDATVNFINLYIDSVSVINTKIKMKFDLVLMNFLFLPLLFIHIPDFLIRINIWYRSRKLRPLLSGNSCKCVITFCDALPEDHIIASIANELGKVSVTFQHGIYYASQNKREENIALSYFISQFMFCWGNSTVYEGALIGLNRNRFILTGKMPNEKFQLEKFKGPTQNILVHLNSRKAHNVNRKIIEIINTACLILDKKYSITIHPDDSIDNYRDIIDHANYEHTESRYSISANVIYSSGVIYDLWRLKAPIICFFNENSPRSFKYYFKSFCDLDSFIEDFNNSGCSERGEAFQTFSIDGFKEEIEKLIFI